MESLTMINKNEMIQNQEIITVDNSNMKEIALKAFPNYKGRKFSIKIQDSAIDLRSYWSGGSRDYFVLLSLTDEKRFDMPQQSMFDKELIEADNVILPVNLVCVENSIFCGKDMGITIHINSKNAKLLSENEIITELSRNEKIVLIYTRTFKNTYAGRTNIRYAEAMKDKGISSEDWQNASKTLIEKKLLNKIGALTNEGRNYIGDLKAYQV